MKEKLIILFVFISIFVISCKRDNTIYFDNVEPLALVPDVQWAVVIEPYAAFRKDMSWDSEVLGHCRKSDILQVKGMAISTDGSWYKFNEGWLPDSAISIYTNKFKAKTASVKLE